MIKIKLKDGTILTIAKGQALPEGAVIVEEQKGTDDLDAKIASAVGAAVAPLVEKLSKKATNNMGGSPATEGESADIQVGKDAADGTGINLARMVKALYVSKHHGRVSASEVAKGWGYAKVAKMLEVGEAKGLEFSAQRKAVSQGAFDSLGIFVEHDLATEIFELLRPRVWVRNRARSVPLVAGLDFNKQTGSTQAFYKGELDAITPSQPTAGRESMTEKELTAMSVFSNRLLQTATLGAEQFVRDDILNIIARKENLSFYRGDGTQGTPRGIRNRVAASQIFSATVAGATATLAEVRADLARMERKLEEADAPMQSLAWIMSPRVKAFLRSITDGNGNAVFEAELNAGRLGGHPADVSTQVPNNLGAGTASELGLVDYSEVILGQGDMFLEMFPNATYEEGGVVKSGVNRNQSVLRAIQYHDLIMRHDVSGAFMQVPWGA